MHDGNSRLLRITQAAFAIIPQTTFATLRRVFSRAAQFPLVSPEATEVKVPFCVTLP